MSSYAKTLIPAYGRDYKSIKEVKAAWAAGQDFIIADISDRYDGKPINRQDASMAGIACVGIRYSRLMKQVMIKVTSPPPAVEEDDLSALARVSNIMTVGAALRHKQERGDG